MSKKPEAKFDKILWIDLEMTGLSPNDDLILEVAAIVTDWNFKELATYTGVVKNEPKLMQKRMKQNGVFWDEFPASRDGVIEQNSSGKSLGAIEKQLLGFINKNIKKNDLVLLAGNSVHMDRRFIIESWPKLDKKLYYRMLDVSAWKVVFENKYKRRYAKPDAHRALDDIRGSIEELQYYLKMIK
jgi:oligoribonuclease